MTQLEIPLPDGPKYFHAPFRAVVRRVEIYDDRHVDVAFDPKVWGPLLGAAEITQNFKIRDGYTIIGIYRSKTGPEYKVCFYHGNHLEWIETAPSVTRRLYKTRGPFPWEYGAGVLNSVARAMRLHFERKFYDNDTHRI